MSFLKELKRRNVYRVAAFYIIVTWLVLQVVDVLLDFLPLPEWTGSLVFVLLVVGFPIALIMAWAFELTPDGIRPEAEPGKDVRPRSRSRTSDLLLGLGIVVVIAFWAYSYLQPDGQIEPVTEAEIRSLVVLPLDNLISDPNQAYFVEGMHDSLITELSRIKSLRIISRTSAMRYQDSKKPLPEIARELGVDAVVEGSVLLAGNTVRINVQLINAQSDQHIWGAQFDRELNNILSLYTEVTRQITGQIRVQVSPLEIAHLAQVKPVVAGAYDLYLKGTHLCDQWTPKDMIEGLDHLRQAVMREPENALYHSALAVCLQYTAYYDYIAPVVVRDEALMAANQAVLLNAQLDMAHVAKGAVSYYLDFDWRSAEQSLKRALELNPTMDRALTHLSWLLGEQGQTDAAVDLALKAIAADPFSPAVHQALGQAYFLGRKFKLANKSFETALSLAAGDSSMYVYSAWGLEQAGLFDEAVALCRTAVELSVNAPIHLSELGYMLGRAGKRDEAMAVLKQLQDMEPDTRVQPVHYAKVYLGLNLYEQSIDLLEQAFEARNASLMYLANSAQYDPLRDKPRFQALLNKIIN